MFGPQSQFISEEQVAHMKKYTQDSNQALENNYNCVKDTWVEQELPVKGGPREAPPAFDSVNLPANYFKCFWNLDVEGTMKAEGDA